MDDKTLAADGPGRPALSLGKTLVELVDAAIEQRTLAALARDAGVSPQQIWNWRTARTEMGRKLYLGLQRSLGLSAQEMADAWAAAESVLAGQRIPPGLR
jgi:hypothetical protein